MGSIRSGEGACDLVEWPLLLRETQSIGGQTAKLSPNNQDVSWVQDDCEANITQE